MMPGSPFCNGSLRSHIRLFLNSTCNLCLRLRLFYNIRITSVSMFSDFLPLRLIISDKSQLELRNINFILSFSFMFDCDSFIRYGIIGDYISP